MYTPEITDQDIAKLKYALRNSIGEANRMTYEQLTAAVYGTYTPTLRRNIRSILQHVNLDQSDPTILSTDTGEGGIWLADDDPLPIAKMYASEHSRGVSILAKASAIEAKAKRKYGKAAWAQAVEDASKTEKQETLFDSCSSVMTETV